MLLPKVLTISRSWIAIVIPFEGSGTPVLKLSELSKTWKHYLSHEKVQQVIDLQIADRLIQSRNATTYYADLRLLVRQLFLESYKKEQYFRISVLGLDTATWRLQGRYSFKCEKCTFDELESSSEKF